MKRVILLVMIFSVFSNVNAATEYATFESFYTESLGWGTVINALIGAAIVGAIVYFSGGLASPLVAGSTSVIGSTIGNILGYSGAVATKTGLAFLGGGAIASGGFGMLGGAVVITTALEFSTGLMLGYAIETHTANYNQAAFIEHSKNMMNLPLPVQKEGSHAYEAAMVILQKIDKEQPIVSPNNKLLLKQALDANERSLNEEWQNVAGKRLQLLTFKCLLYSSVDDYSHAKETAEKAIIYAKQQGYKYNLPEFIYALSSLYEEKPNINKITQSYLKESILGEPDNLLLPVAMTAYLDRLIYRYTSDNMATEEHIKQVALIATHPTLQKYSIVNLSIIMVRYFTLLKLQQQHITAIVTSTNDTIRNSPQSSKKLKTSLTAYAQLLKDGREVLNILLHQSIDHMNDEQRRKTEVELRKFRSLMNEYEKDEKRLITLVTN
ncbi:MAG: hypothetical protein PHP00_09380 [Thiotrichaceae bacterium]|nr:hypothetical protein [Thiotrichaceae bacterium]